MTFSRTSPITTTTTLLTVLALAGRAEARDCWVDVWGRRRCSSGLSTGARIGIGIGIAVAILALVSLCGVLKKRRTGTYMPQWKAMNGNQNYATSTLPYNAPPGQQPQGEYGYGGQQRHGGEAGWGQQGYGTYPSPAYPPASYTPTGQQYAPPTGPPPGHDQQQQYAPPPGPPPPPNYNIATGAKMQ